MRPRSRRSRSPFATLTLLALVTLLAACSSLTGQTAGEKADDAQITAAVKSRLAAEKLAGHGSDHEPPGDAAMRITASRGPVEQRGLAASAAATGTRVGVETNLRNVYLTGVVDSEETRQRAAEIAWSVTHVNGVVNHLIVQKKG